MEAVPGVKVGYGRTFLALAGFMVAFFGARAFATAYPDTVIVNQGIHFHHFWYGLGMVVVAGWLGIASFHPSLNRLYATVFGLGGGLVGDEVGLLLTLGDYHSELTYVFFVGLVCVVVALVLVFRFGGELKADLEGVGRGEGVAHLGIVVGGLSALPFSVGAYPYGVTLAAAGMAIVAVGLQVHRRSSPAAVLDDENHPAS